MPAALQARVDTNNVTTITGRIIWCFMAGGYHSRCLQVWSFQCNDFMNVLEGLFISVASMAGQLNYYPVSNKKVATDVKDTWRTVGGL